MQEEVIAYKTSLTKAQVKAKLPQAIAEFSRRGREFLYRDDGDNAFRIGIERGGHSGFWYLARCRDLSEGCEISGTIVYDPDGYTKKQDGKENKDSLLSEIFVWIFVAIFVVIEFLLFCIPIAVASLVKLIRKEKTKEEYLDLFMCEFLACEKIEKAVYVPKNAEELYQKIIAEQENVKGQLVLQDENCIEWTFDSGLVVLMHAYADSEEGLYEFIYRQGQKEKMLTHSHPMKEDLYSDFLEINDREKLLEVSCFCGVYCQRIYSKQECKKKNSVFVKRYISD